MSKAFTREDDAVDTPRPIPVPLLPPGVRNYLTPTGRDRLQAELSGLRERRPALLEGSVSDPELRGELAGLDERIAVLERSLATAEVVEPPAPPHERVRFGSTVTVEDPAGQRETYRIVGADEADLSRQEVSWRSPIASALLNAPLGATVPFRFPSGATQLRIVAIR